MFIGIYILVVVVHLVGCLLPDRKLANITKPLLMPLLIAVVYFGDLSISVLVYLALAFSFLGDLFMMNEDSTVTISFGIASFGISQILYAAEIFSGMIMPSILATILAVIAYLTLSILVFNKLKEYLPPIMKIPTLFYLVVIVSMSFAATLQLTNSVNMSTVLIFIGSLLFIVSDIVLAFRIFKKDSRCTSFIVMSTYISAQSLLVLGFAVF